MRLKAAWVFISLLLFVAAGQSACSAALHRDTPSLHADVSVPPELAEKILRLDPLHITEQDVNGLLALSPAPRIIPLNGSLPLISMDSFSRFLIAMGYPEARIRSPRDRTLSYSSYISSRKLAGMIAWHYEKEGMMPLLIGHSQGGMVVVKVLHELAGAFSDSLAVYDPLRRKWEDRSVIIDPVTGIERPVLGLTIPFASAIATGKFMRVLLGQWSMIGRLRKIPDTVEEFAGFSLQYDFIGTGRFGRAHKDEYLPLGTAAVHNVVLPAGYRHMTLPVMEHLAHDRASREWINRYVPAGDAAPAAAEGLPDSDNIVLAAELWYYIKKYWCRELQKYVRGQAAHGRRVDNDAAAFAERGDSEHRNNDAGHIKYFSEDHPSLERSPSLQRGPRGESARAP